MRELKKRWRRFEVRLQKSSRVQNTLRALISAYVGFTYRRIRWQRIGMERIEADFAQGRPHVMCCWHEQLMYTPYVRDWGDHGLFIMASRHADAQLATANMEKMPGVDILHVATSGDNSAPIRDCVKRIRSGQSMGISVDGPMGPARSAKPGAIVIAGLAGVPVTPIAIAVTHKIRLRTWDRFIVPMPWGRGVFVVGEGFTPPRRMTPDETEAACDKLGRLIDAMTEGGEAALARTR